jgi:hypothetical protein
MVVDSFWFPEVVYWLSGLTSDHKTFSEKAGAFQAACDNEVVLMDPGSLPGARRTQEDPGGPRRTQEDPGGPRKIMENPGGSRPSRIQENRGVPRRRPGREQGPRERQSEPVGRAEPSTLPPGDRRRWPDRQLELPGRPGEPERRPGGPGRGTSARGEPPKAFRVPWSSWHFFWLLPGFPGAPSD